MFVQASVLSLTAFCALALAQSFTAAASTPTITPSPFVTAGITVNNYQAQQISQNIGAYQQSLAQNPPAIATDVVQALVKAGESPEDILNNVLSVYGNAAATARTGAAAIVDIATASPYATELPFESPLPKTLLQAFDAYGKSVACDFRQIARSGLALSSDAVATDCAMVQTAGTLPQSTGAAAAVRPTSPAMLAGGLVAAGMVGAVAVLL